MPQLATLKIAFEDAIAAAAQGGMTATAAKNNAREALIEALRKNAYYVEINANFAKLRRDNKAFGSAALIAN